MAGIHEVNPPKKHKMVEGFVRADPREVQKGKPYSVPVNPSRHAEIIGTGQRYDVVQNGDQFYVVRKGTNDPVTPAVGGAFIAFGQLKELEGGQSATPTGKAQNPMQHTEKGESAKKSEGEKEKEAEDRLDDLTK